MILDAKRLANRLVLLLLLLLAVAQLVLAIDVDGGGTYCSDPIGFSSSAEGIVSGKHAMGKRKVQEEEMMPST